MLQYLFYWEKQKKKKRDHPNFSKIIILCNWWQFSNCTNARFKSHQGFDCSKFGLTVTWSWVLRGAEQRARILQGMGHEYCTPKFKHKLWFRNGNMPDQVTGRFVNLTLYFIFFLLNIPLKYFWVTEAMKIPFISPCCCPLNEVKKRFIVPLWWIHKHQTK